MSQLAKIKAIRVLLIDDSPIIRLGLRSALEDYPGITIVGEATNAATGLTAVTSHKPDVVLLDLHLPDQSGLHVCRELLKIRPQTQVLILTSSDSERHVQEAMNAGAQGYLLKDNDGATLAEAIRSVAKGTPVLDQAMAGRVMQLVKHGANLSASQKLNLLSPQERKVVALLAEGQTNKKIGEQMGLTEKTIKNYLATVFGKLDIERRTQAVALYIEASGQAK